MNAQDDGRQAVANGLNTLCEGASWAVIVSVNRSEASSPCGEQPAEGVEYESIKMHC